MKQILKKMELDPKQFRDRAMLSAISNAKNELIDAGGIPPERRGRLQREENGRGLCHVPGGVEKKQCA